MVGLRLALNRGGTTVVLPAQIAARLGPGAYTVSLALRDATTASGLLRITG